MVGAGLGLLLVLPDIYALADPFDTMTGETSLQRAFFVGVPSALIVWGFLNLQIRWPKFLIDLGDASYSIFLAHAVIMYPLSYTLLPGVLQTYSLPFHLLMFGWTSFFCYQWIEKPLLERIRHRRRREAEAELAPSGAPA